MPLQELTRICEIRFDFAIIYINIWNSVCVCNNLHELLLLSSFLQELSRTSHTLIHFVSHSWNLHDGILQEPRLENGFPTTKFKYRWSTTRNPTPRNAARMQKQNSSVVLRLRKIFKQARQREVPLNSYKNKARNEQYNKLFHYHSCQTSSWSFRD